MSVPPQTGEALRKICLQFAVARAGFRIRDYAVASALWVRSVPKKGSRRSSGDKTNYGGPGGRRNR